jgi:hypothetical protein
MFLPSWYRRNQSPFLAFLQIFREFVDALYKRQLIREDADDVLT